MQGPFSALYAKYADQRSIIEDLVAQIEGVASFGIPEPLLYHAWDES